MIIAMPQNILCSTFFDFRMLDNPLQNFIDNGFNKLGLEREIFTINIMVTITATPVIPYSFCGISTS